MKTGVFVHLVDSYLYLLERALARRRCSVPSVCPGRMQFVNRISWESGEHLKHIRNVDHPVIYGAGWEPTSMEIYFNKL